MKCGTFMKAQHYWYFICFCFFFSEQKQVHAIDKNGELTTLRLGREAERGDVFQGVAYAGTWFAAQLEDPSAQVCEG